MFVAMATAMLLVVSVLVRGASRESARRTRAETELDAEQRLVEYLEVALLPAQLPTVTGVTVAARYVSGSPGRVGGDWYPAFQIAPDRIGLTVGDVVGHGVDATGAMAEMRHALRAFASVGPHPRRVPSRSTWAWRGWLRPSCGSAPLTSMRSVMACSTVYAASGSRTPSSCSSHASTRRRGVRSAERYAARRRSALIRS